MVFMSGVVDGVPSYNEPGGRDGIPAHWFSNAFRFAVDTDVGFGMAARMEQSAVGVCSIPIRPQQDFSFRGMIFLSDCARSPRLMSFCRGVDETQEDNAG